MAEYPVDRLTEAQRASLRLVYLHHNSKEIAARMGVSPSAIDKRIERAVQILGVSTRFEAARILKESDDEEPQGDGSTCERLPSEAIDVPESVISRPSGVSNEPWGLVGRFLGLGSGRGMEGMARVRSTRTERFVRFVLITVGIAIASVALVSLLMTVTSMLRASRG